MNVNKSKGPTARQVIIATHIAHGQTRQEVADLLGISLGTVIRDCRMLITRCGCRSISHAIASLIRAGRIVPASEGINAHTIEEVMKCMTERRYQIARMLADGGSYNDIGPKLGITPHCAGSYHMQAIRDLLLPRTKAHLVAMLMAIGIIE